MNPWQNRPVYVVTDKTDIEALFTNYGALTTDLNKRVAAWRIEIERRDASAERTRLLEELQIVGDNTNGDNLTYAKTTDAVLLANIKEKVIDNDLTVFVPVAKALNHSRLTRTELTRLWLARLGQPSLDMVNRILRNGRATGPVDKLLSSLNECNWIQTKGNFRMKSYQTSEYGRCIPGENRGIPLW
jgi:hypothetical protein